MTNRQIAAKLVRNALIQGGVEINGLTLQAIAAAGGKHHTSKAAADKVKALANKFLDPWIARMEKVSTPKQPKEKTEEAASSAPF